MLYLDSEYVFHCQKGSVRKKELQLLINSSKNLRGRFQDGDYREEAESMLPKVESWRDTGNTFCRKNHQEEAKFQYLHTPSPHIASPLHVKQRNQEGSHTTRHQLPTCLGERSRPPGELSSTQYSHKQPWDKSA
jgi:hypothetical protein